MTDLTNSSYSASQELSKTMTVSKKMWMRPLKALLNGLEYGALKIVFPNGEILGFDGHVGNGPTATILLKNYKPIRTFFLKGELAFAESYLTGEWDTPDLTALFEFALANEKSLSPDKKGNFLVKFMQRLGHLRNANSRAGSRKNISFHYDLGNRFYEKWLDQSMTYSSALFEQGAETLEDAQNLKYRKIAQMAELKQDETILEIGCGWGGFSEVAANEYGAKIHGVTLSTEQLDFATKRYADGGYADKASASLTDYRDTEGQYDKIVSIEMFEAVGHEYWSTYFKVIQDRLKPGGIALLQVILIDDKRFEKYRRNVDFIQKYIFPGGLLPSKQALSYSIDQHGLTLEEDFLFGRSYAKTCQIWRDEFLANWEEIEPLGFDEKFKRMWLYYLSYCEAGFAKGSIDVGLFKIRKPS
ncbi:class I SAM-dependent methyltransferase [Curvivirga sp.]|uniref:class I SAM-dependent methyltransferase n=1 Tax=Curvivirga sp. TaxID=2856848 RepID=UPI003B599E27